VSIDTEPQSSTISPPVRHSVGHLLQSLQTMPSRWKRKSRRAQVTIFLMAGIVLMIVFSATLYLRNYTSSSVTSGQLDQYIQQGPEQGQALELSAEISANLQELRTISDLLLDGLPQEQILQEHDIPIFFGHGQSTLPTSSELSRRISAQVKKRLSDLTVSDCGMDTSRMSVETQILPGSLDITISGARLRCSDGVHEVQPSPVSIPSNLHTVMEVTDKIVSKQISAGNSISLSYVNTVCREQNLDCVLIPYDQDTIIYSIAEKDGTLPPLIFAGQL